MGEFSKVEDYRVKIPKSIAIPYTNNHLSKKKGEREMRMLGYSSDEACSLSMQEALGYSLSILPFKNRSEESKPTLKITEMDKILRNK